MIGIMHLKTIFLVLVVVLVGGWRLNNGPNAISVSALAKAEPIVATTSHFHYNQQQGSMTKLTGRHRRILRAIANREKQRGALPIVQVSFNRQPSSDLPTISVQSNGAVLAKADFQQSSSHLVNQVTAPVIYVNSAEQFASDMCDQLSEMINQKELIQVKFTHGVNKKYEAKALGQRIAQRIANCELVQVLGHSILLYKKAAQKAKTTFSSPFPTADVVSSSSLSGGRITAMMEEEFRISVEREDDD